MGSHGVKAPQRGRGWVGLASELLGLSTLWLPGFYQRHSNHNFTQLAEPAAARG